MDNTRVRQSAQAIVINEKGRLILEKNKKIMREFREETGLLIDGVRFCESELQPITDFGTGKCESTYFLLQVSKDEAYIILANSNFIVFSNRPYSNFPIEKERFIKQVRCARNYFTISLGN